MSRTSRLLRATLPFTFAASGIAQSAHAQTVAAGADQSSQDAPANSDEDIVVTGSYARSLATAAETKRQAAYGVDSIASTDIGKFPTQNVAEALQLVTGVAITRPRGEGLYVSVRGLGPQFQSTMLNGRTIAINDLIENGGANGRQFRFEMLPAEFVSQIDVVKTPTADMTEGALGGNIDVKTFRPLDVGTKTTLNLRGTWTTMTDKVKSGRLGTSSFAHLYTVPYSKSGPQTPTAVPGDLSLAYVSALFDTRQRGGTLDYTGFHTPALDTLLRAASASPDGPPRREAWTSVQRALDTLAPATWIYHSRGVQGVSRRVRGATMDLRGELVTVHDWSLSPRGAR